MKRKDEEHFVLSTGRVFYACMGAIGLFDAPFPDGGKLTPTHGFDGYISEDNPEREVDGVDSWTPEERAELADYAIKRWEQFKAQG